MVNKKFVMFGAIVGMTVGSALPVLWGKQDFFDPMSIGLATVGGFIGIWLAVLVSKRFS